MLAKISAQTGSKMAKNTPISPQSCRYIKLGAGGMWNKWAFENGQIPFGYRSITHEPCIKGDWDKVTEDLIKGGERKHSKAKDGTREICDFYTLGRDTLWVTFADGYLWWALADTKITYHSDSRSEPNRTRKTIRGWQNTTINGNPLKTESLSSRLTQVASYRGTICSIKEEQYLIRRINEITEPIIALAQQAKGEMLQTATTMIKNLHWADFEVMVELIFARTGWQRVSRIGGTMKDVDITLKHPTIGETAFVQVKSKADKSVLEDYINRFKSSGIYDRLFFVCHTLRGNSPERQSSNIKIWTDSQLAEAALNAGLYDWLIEKSL